MAPPVQQALSFLAALRSRKFRAASLVLLAAILLAQTLLVVHREQSRPEHSAACALCVAADHAAAPSHHTAVALAPSVPDTVLASIRPLAAALVILSYRSRAPPPEHHRA